MRLSWLNLSLYSWWYESSLGWWWYNLRLGLSQGLCNNRGSNNSWGNWRCSRFDWGNFNSVVWGSFMTLYNFLFGWINVVMWCGGNQCEML